MFEQILYPLIGGLVGYVLQYWLEKSGFLGRFNQREETGSDAILFNHKIALATWLSLSACAAAIFILVKS